MTPLLCWPGLKILGLIYIARRFQIVETMLFTALHRSTFDGLCYIHTWANVYYIGVIATDFHPLAILGSPFDLTATLQGRQREGSVANFNPVADAATDIGEINVADADNLIGEKRRRHDRCGERNLARL